MRGQCFGSSGGIDLLPCFICQVGLICAHKSNWQDAIPPVFLAQALAAVTQQAALELRAKADAVDVAADAAELMRGQAVDGSGGVDLLPGLSSMDLLRGQQKVLMTGTARGFDML
jgi:hypothetical protein